MSVGVDGEDPSKRGNSSKFNSAREQEDRQKQASAYWAYDAMGPLKRLIEEDKIVEISGQKSGEVWVERLGSNAMERELLPEWTEAAARNFAISIASYSKQVVNDQKPLLSAALPGGERVQFCLYPTSTTGTAFSIRKQVIRNLSLEDYAAMGAFDRLRVVDENTTDPDDEKLMEFLDAGDVPGFLRYAVVNRKSMIVSGGTSTGKTTFLNMLLSLIPMEERIGILEDTRELDPRQENVFSLLASKGEQGQAAVTMNQLLEAVLRFRPDRIFMGELRGAEAFAFLNAINTGHPGSITTVHANTPLAAYDRISTMVLMGGVNMRREDIIAYVRSIIPIVIQLQKAPIRHTSDIYFANRVKRLTG
jgi:type IV secretion system protein VirB11